MENISDLKKLLEHELNDLYSAEVQIIDALPKMVEKATNPKLKKALSDHLKVTYEHKKRLDEMHKLLNSEKAKKQNQGFWANLFASSEGEEHCKATEGLVKEGESMMSEDMPPAVMDAAIIAAAQKIEHYEISSYGTAKAFAQQLGLSKIASLLNKTLNEEYKADDSLTKLAFAEINKTAENKRQPATNTNKATAKKIIATKSTRKTPVVKKATSKATTGKKLPVAGKKTAATKKTAMPNGMKKSR